MRTCGSCVFWVERNPTEEHPERQELGYCGAPIPPWAKHSGEMERRRDDAMAEDCRAFLACPVRAKAQGNGEA